jgi:hypothetical protein
MIGIDHVVRGIGEEGMALWVPVHWAAGKGQDVAPKSSLPLATLDHQSFNRSGGWTLCASLVVPSSK